VFCGADDRRLSDEHVFADWITDVAGFRGKPVSHYLDRYDGTVVEFRREPFQSKVKVVCEPCNNGWMSGLETRTKPVLGPMIIGQEQMLRTRDQRLLAFWAVKTALMVEHLVVPAARVIPESAYRALYEAGQPDPRQLVLLSHRTHTGPGTRLVHSIKQRINHLEMTPEVADANRDAIGRWLEAGECMYRITFAVGAVVFLVFGHTFPIRVGVGIPAVGPVVRIWTVSGRFTWPSTPSVESIGGLDALHQSFDRDRDGNEIMPLFPDETE
jgi:hypothetical protein